MIIGLPSLIFKWEDSSELDEYFDGQFVIISTFLKNGLCTDCNKNICQYQTYSEIYSGFMLIGKQFKILENHVNLILTLKQFSEMEKMFADSILSVISYLRILVCGLHEFKQIINSLLTLVIEGVLKADKVNKNEEEVNSSLVGYLVGCLETYDLRNGANVLTIKYVLWFIFNNTFQGWIKSFLANLRGYVDNFKLGSCNKDVLSIFSKVSIYHIHQSQIEISMMIKSGYFDAIMLIRNTDFDIALDSSSSGVKNTSEVINFIRLNLQRNKIKKILKITEFHKVPTKKRTKSFKKLETPNKVPPFN